MFRMEQIKSFEAPTAIFSASLHPSKSCFVAGGDDFKLYKFDYEDGKELGKAIKRQNNYIQFFVLKWFASHFDHIFLTIHLLNILFSLVTNTAQPRPIIILLIIALFFFQNHTKDTLVLYIVSDIHQMVNFMPLALKMAHCDCGKTLLAKLMDSGEQLTMV